MANRRCACAARSARSTPSGAAARAKMNPRSRPASSFCNITHMTLRPLLLVAGAGAACECPQESAMLLIVVDLRVREHRQLGVDGKPQVRVRGAQRPLDAVRRGGTGEDEPEIEAGELLL